MKRLALSPLALILAAATLAPAADDLGAVLGEEYAKAKPVDKLVRISIALADRKLQGGKARSRAQEEVDAIFLEAMGRVKSAEDKLKVLGKLRREAQSKIRAEARERIEAKVAGFLRFLEPDPTIQRAVALNFIADRCGGRPSLEQLEALSAVRENTDWTSNSSLVLSLVLEALTRDEAYRKADHLGKLTIIRGLVKDKKMISPLEGTYLDKAVLTDWISGRLKSGEEPAAIQEEVSRLAKRGMIFDQTAIWAQRFLERLAQLRAS